MRFVRFLTVMSFAVPNPSHVPCEECGASVLRGAEHTCDRDRWVDFNVIRLRPEFDRFEDEVSEYLDTPQGRFEAWYAEHRRDAA